MKDISENRLGELRTELVDSKYRLIDLMSVGELLHAMNESDAEVPRAVARDLPVIERAIIGITEHMKAGGRLIYLGAGTSGRLGVLDAAECGPTFSVSPDEVIAFIAGGDRALRFPVEGAEDDTEAARVQLKSIRLERKDVVVGIAASGRTPYVQGGLEYAMQVGALTISLTCNPDSEISIGVDHAIEIDTGPELLAGSTRLKSGTAQKLVLNMISTATMIQLGKTFGNLMVDLQITNEKLHDRAIRIIESATGATREASQAALSAANLDVKVAILMLLLDLDVNSARDRLSSSSNRIREALING